MSPEKLREVIAMYRKAFTDQGIGKIDYPHDELLDFEKHALEHCHGMLDQMETFIDEGRIDKAFRWLGFMQGVFWSHGYYTLAQLMDHNRTIVPS